MAMLTTTNGGLTPTYQTYFNKSLLDYAKPLVVTAQFAQKKPFPKNKGATNMTFFRPNSPDRAAVNNLVEGVPLANYREINYTAVNVALSQVGEAARISDIVTNTDLFSTLDNASRTMGEDAGAYADFQCVQQVCNLTTGVAVGDRRYGSLGANFAGAGKLTIKDLLGSYTQLTIEKARKPEGREYVAIIAPQQQFDVMDDTKFIDTGTKREGVNNIFEGEIGKWYGNRILVTTEPWIETVEGTYAAGGDHYACMVLGRESLGAAIMAGNSPFSPSLIVTTKPDSANPLAQFVTAGWKAYWATVMLNRKWAVVISSTTTYVA